MDNDLRDIILEITETTLSAQLRAIRRLRNEEDSDRGKIRKSTYHMDMVQSVLEEEGEGGTHITKIIEMIRKRYKVTLNRDSLVSSLTKKVKIGDRFLRTGRNTFALKREKE